MPVAAVLDTVRVISDVPEPGAAMEAGLKLTVDARRLAACGQGNRRVKAAGDSRGDDRIAAGALTEVPRSGRDGDGEGARRGQRSR